MRDAVAQALKGDGRYRAEFRQIREDGTVTWFAGRGELLRDGDGRPVRMLGLNYDITERKRLEEALRESEERLRLAQEASGIGSWDWNLRADTVIWSARNFALLGVDPAEVRPSYAAFFETIHPDDRGHVEAAVQTALREGNVLEAEFRVAASRGGATRWLQCRGEVRRDADGEPIRMLGVIRVEPAV